MNCLSLFRSVALRGLAVLLLTTLIGCGGAGEKDRNKGKDKPRPDDHGAIGRPLVEPSPA